MVREQMSSLSVHSALTHGPSVFDWAAVTCPLTLLPCLPTLLNHPQARGLEYELDRVANRAARDKQVRAWAELCRTPVVGCGCKHDVWARLGLGSRVAALCVQQPSPIAPCRQL